MNHANHIRTLDALRQEITARLPVVDQMMTEARHNLVILGPIAQLNHALNDSLTSIRYVIELLAREAEAHAPKRKRGNSKRST